MHYINSEQLIRNISLIMLMGSLLLSPCYADEIIFKNQKSTQIGTVLEKDEQTVTIQSIVRSQEKVFSAEKNQYLKPAPSTELQFQKQLEQLQERIERLEKDKKTVVYQRRFSRNKIAHEQLLQEEMGRVEGIILWKKKPLADARVRIVLEKYTGFSLAFIRKMFSGDKEKSSNKIILETKTDSQGQYVFEKVPPGQYRLHWMPDAETDWVHRMREKPDFEIITGKLTLQNIPDKKKE